MFMIIASDLAWMYRFGFSVYVYLYIFLIRVLLLCCVKQNRESAEGCSKCIVREITTHSGKGLEVG